MSFTITLTADDLQDLCSQMFRFMADYDFVDLETKEERIARGKASEPKPPKKARQKAPVAETEPIEPATVEPIEEEEEGEVYDLVGQANANENALAHARLKQEVIDSLQALFMSGKVKVVRHVLDKYGNGAKSFPEIDASVFPAIKEALDRGEAA